MKKNELDDSLKNLHKPILFNCTHCNESNKIEWVDTDTRDLIDKVDSLHQRVNKFFEWAAILQKEFRNMQQRQKFIESQCQLEFSQSK